MNGEHLPICLPFDCNACTASRAYLVAWAASASCRHPSTTKTLVANSGWN